MPRRKRSLKLPEVGTKEQKMRSDRIHAVQKQANESIDAGAFGQRIKWILRQKWKNGAKLSGFQRETIREMRRRAILHALRIHGIVEGKQRKQVMEDTRLIFEMAMQQAKVTRELSEEWSLEKEEKIQEYATIIREARIRLESVFGDQTTDYLKKVVALYQGLKGYLDESFVKGLE